MLGVAVRDEPVARDRPEHREDLFVRTRGQLVAHAERDRQFTRAAAHDRDTTVAGDGSYAIEAGRSGTLIVTGSIRGAAIHLDVSYDSGTEAHFDGTLTTPTLLSGAIKYGPAASLIASQAVSFERKR